MEQKPNLLSVIHCEMIDTLSNELWDEILKQEFVVFARATPSHKLFIVKVYISLKYCKYNNSIYINII